MFPGQERAVQNVIRRRRVGDLGSRLYYYLLFNKTTIKWNFHPPFK